MNKKNKLKGGLDSLFTPQQTDTLTEELPTEVGIQATDELLQAARPLFRRGRPNKEGAERPAAERGCRTGEKRITFLMNKEQAEQLKDAAYWQRISVKDALQEAIAAYLANYQQKNGPLKSRKK